MPTTCYGLAAVVISDMEPCSATVCRQGQKADISVLQKLKPIACVQSVGDMPSAEAKKPSSCHMQSCSLRCDVHKHSQGVLTTVALHAIAELIL